MTAYILRRLLLIIPTLFGIMLLNFLIIQAAPGGPVEKMILQLTTADASQAASRISGATSDFAAAANQQTAKPQPTDSVYRGARGLDPELIEAIKKMYGFDRPAHERFFKMISDYLRLDFGTKILQATRFMRLSGDAVVDMAHIAGCFEGVRAYRPAQAAPVCLLPAQGAAARQTVPDS